MIPLFFFLKNAFFFAIALFGWPAWGCRCACCPVACGVGSVCAHVGVLHRARTHGHGVFLCRVGGVALRLVVVVLGHGHVSF